jgi:hypothetical protein
VEPNPAPTIPPKTKTVISSRAVLDAAAKHPRHHLGDFIYEPGLKPERLHPNTTSGRGFSSNPKPLPWDIIKGKINCTLTVKVPRINLSQVAREEITARGYLWGTDVYSDDSDVVAACIHGGWIKGEWQEEVDVRMLDVDRVPEKRGAKSANNTVDLETEGLHTSPPASGPMPIPEDRDLHVNVLILPKLAKYSSTTRFGITSREFGGEYGNRHAVHDGLSYMIQGLRWVANGAQPQARLRGKARRERMRKAMMEVKGSFGNIAPVDRDHEKDMANRLRGEIPGNWWKKDGADAGADGEEEHAERGPSEGDKENRLTAEKTTPEEPSKDDEPAKEKDVDMEDAPAASKEGEVATAAKE